MSTEALISWNAPSHLYMEKGQDWYWAVGIIALTVTAVLFIFGNIIPAIFALIASVALVLHASSKPSTVYCEINDRGIIVDDVLHPFLTLDSFWIPHDHAQAKILLKSRKLFMPLIVIYIDEVDPEEIRSILLKYISETEHREPILKLIMERFGF